jgi:hypothetical protein
MALSSADCCKQSAAIAADVNATDYDEARAASLERHASGNDSNRAIDCVTSLIS